MSQELYTIIRKKSDKKEIGTLDYVCGRGRYQDIVINNITFDDNSEHIISSDKLNGDKELYIATEKLETEEHLIISSIEEKISSIQLNILLVANAKTSEVANDYQEKLEENKEDILNTIGEDYFTVNHLYMMLDRARFLAMTLDDEYEVVLCWSN